MVVGYWRKRFLCGVVFLIWPVWLQARDEFEPLVKVIGQVKWASDRLDFSVLDSNEKTLANGWVRSGEEASLFWAPRRGLFLGADSNTEFRVKANTVKRGAKELMEEQLFVIELMEGRLLCHYDKRLAYKTEYGIQTPHGIAYLRGGTFILEVKRDALIHMMVVRGRVAFQFRGGRHFTVHSGELAMVNGLVGEQVFRNQVELSSEQKIAIEANCCDGFKLFVHAVGQHGFYVKADILQRGVRSLENFGFSVSDSLRGEVDEAVAKVRKRDVKRREAFALPEFIIDPDSRPMSIGAN